MSEPSGYILDSDIECDRLERQALVQGPDCVLKHVAPEPGMRILDAGSGSGAISRLLAKTYPQTEVVGVDINPAYVEYARRNATGQTLANLQFHVGDLANLPFDGSGFDIIWSQYVLYFVPDPAQAIGEFRRVAKPNGQIIVKLHEHTLVENDPEDAELQPLIDCFVNAILAGWRGIRLPALFRNAGLHNVQIEIEVDPVWTVLGKIDRHRRQNLEDVLVGPLHRQAHLFGGKDQAKSFLNKWLSYLDRDDTNTVTSSWIAKGRKPQSV